MSGTAFNSPQLDVSDSASHQLGLAHHAKRVGAAAGGCETRQRNGHTLFYNAGGPVLHRMRAYGTAEPCTRLLEAVAIALTHKKGSQKAVDPRCTA